MADLPYPTYEFFAKLPLSQLNFGVRLTFTVADENTAGWDYRASGNETNAYSTGVFKIALIKGASYDIFSNSFFDPLTLKVYDNLGNVVAYSRENELSYGDDIIWDFIAPYTGEYYIDASWSQGSYYKGATLSVYEDRDPVKPNRAPTTSQLFEQISWNESEKGQYVVSATAFTDPDGDVLTYSATQSSGAALPSWLTFDPATRTFTGIPPIGSADLGVLLTAKDPGGLFALKDIIIATRGLAPELMVDLAGTYILRAPAKDATVANLISQVKLGAITAETAIAKMVTLADATVSVASLSYQFFTGKTPTDAGMNYLVSSTGPNPNNLNSAYYQSFNLENRYINFAVNLGKVGEGRAKFEADYGGLTLEQATKKAYGVIFGTQPTDAKVTTLLSGGRDAYFGTYGRDGHDGIGTKAAMVGWLLAEAEKADVGMYARANAAFLTTMPHSGDWAIDLVGVYGKSEYAYGG